VCGGGQACWYFGCNLNNDNDHDDDDNNYNNEHLQVCSRGKIVLSKRTTFARARVAALLLLRLLLRLRALCFLDATGGFSFVEF